MLGVEIAEVGWFVILCLPVDLSNPAAVDFSGISLDLSHSLYHLLLYMAGYPSIGRAVKPTLLSPVGCYRPYLPFGKFRIEYSCYYNYVLESV